MESWKKIDEETFLRVDGAEVKADSLNPARPWTATEPGPEHRILSIAILSKVSPRTWKSPGKAMQAIDMQFPLRFKPADLTLEGMMRELDTLQGLHLIRSKKSLTKC